MNTAWSHFRRFEAAHRNSIWQDDVQHTLYLPDPEKPGKKAMSYLVIFIHDALCKDLHKASSIKAARYICFFTPFEAIGK
ncbi:hypothetical protein [Peribacillus glennii]|uniref:hypothetical protein n=1 Tax=Peribacillus glennii TaxID=2303991 RepID=UPI0018F1B539|nr:hypothetical protein [Peribacillus glennii]